MAIDDKWESILTMAQKNKNKMITEEMSEDILTKCEVDSEQHKAVLSGIYISLIQNTEGDANTVVFENGSKLSLESYRYLTQKGKNVNTANIIKIKTRALKPDGATGVEDIEPKNE